MEKKIISRDNLAAFKAELLGKLSNKVRVNIWHKAIITAMV